MEKFRVVCYIEVAEEMTPEEVEQILIDDVGVRMDLYDFVVLPDSTEY